MNLKSLSDSTLIQKTESLIQEERRVTLALLHHLKELERRKLYCDSGFSSLFDYLTRGHGFSEGSAQRRIDSMRTHRDFPEVEEKIQAGILNLTHLSKAQSHFRQEKSLSREDRQEVLQALEGKSFREMEKELAERASVPVLSREKVREIPQGTQIQFTASPKLMEDLEKLRGLLAHTNPNLSYSELIEKLAEITLQKLDPARKKEREKSAKVPSPSLSLPQTQSSSSQSQSPPTLAIDLLASQAQTPTRTRYIPAAIKREIWKRDQGRCSFQDPKTGRRCSSTRFLQLDHRHDFARGGSNTAENLRLYCANHNIRHTILSFGLKKREAYVRP